MDSGSTLFDTQRFAELRARAGVAWGEPLTYRTKTGSTNDDALAAARAGAPSGSVFLAEQQSAGRGRRGHRWYGASGQSLLFSVLVRPPSGARALSALTLAVGLGVRAALAPHSREPVLVKWPNDILAGRRKLAGILCESQLRAGQMEAVVIGVGINVGPPSVPEAIRAETTCLAELAPAPDVAAGDTASGDASGDGALRERLLVSLLAEIERWVQLCLSQGLAELLDEFRAYDALLGRAVQVSGGGLDLNGIARGVDSEGRLLVESEAVLMPIQSGTVRLC